MSEYELRVPHFGTLKGKVTNGISEFQNVKFGHVPHRFAPSELFIPTSPDTQIFDCTQQGPLCPQKEPFNDDCNGVPLNECAPLDLKFNEQDCLNMRLILPTQINQCKLPVVVWLHGGSNIAGSPYRGSSRAHSWLQTGMENGKPFIFIAPHYRVGLFGWMPHNSHVNHAIGDQQLVLQWIHKYGPGIGADLSKITLVGQSAGASCAYSHIWDPQTTKLASQIALLSGHYGESAFATLEDYNQLAKRIASEIGCSLDDLTTVDCQEIVKAQVKLNITVYAAVNVGKKCPDDSNGLRLIVGDCERDAHFMADTPEEMLDLPPNTTVVSFFTDNFFRSCANTLWKEFKGPVYRQLCDGINPYTPSWGNNHMVELHYILNGYNLKSDTIKTVQRVWAALIHYDKPWNADEQVFWIPPHGIPQVISSAEAWTKRQVRSPILDNSELIRTMRGW